MKYRKLALAGALIAAGWLSIFAPRGDALVDCVDGCYSFWTGQKDINGTCWMSSPYNCVDNETYRFDTDEGGSCVAVDPSDTHPEYSVYSCGGMTCSPVCDLCPQQSVCLQYGEINQGCTYIDKYDRKECSGD